MVYQDGDGRQKLLFPDYVLGVRGELWIVEVKAGFERGALRIKAEGKARKHAVLIGYLERYGLKGGTLRWDEETDSLSLCMGSYSEEPSDGKRLDEIFG